MKDVLLVVEVPSGEYCWPPLKEDDDIEVREMCHYLELSGGCSTCNLGFDIDSPTEKTPFVKKDPYCANLLEANSSFFTKHVYKEGE